jgi:hypothetical protein
MTYFYEYAAGIWRIGNMYLPTGQYILEDVDGDKFLIRNTANLVVQFELRATTCMNGLGTAYASFAAILSVSGGFFGSINN